MKYLDTTQNGQVYGFNDAIEASEEFKQFKKLCLPREDAKLLKLLSKSVRRCRDLVFFNMRLLENEIRYALSERTVRKGLQKDSWKPAECELLHGILNAENFTYSLQKQKVLDAGRKKPPQFLLDALELALQKSLES